MTLYDQFLETATDEEIQEVKSVQGGINSGSIWHFEGSAGRHAMSFIDAGLCELGKKGHKDYWGNYVPSKFEVKSGTKGAPLNTRLA